MSRSGRWARTNGADTALRRRWRVTRRGARPTRLALDHTVRLPTDDQPAATFWRLAAPDTARTRDARCGRPDPPDQIRLSQPEGHHMSMISDAFARTMAFVTGRAQPSYSAAAPRPA